MKSKKKAKLSIFSLFIVGMLAMGSIMIANSIICQGGMGASDSVSSFNTVYSASLSMDTNLSDSDASFYGEEAGDNSGGSIANAGDVNGDGYDDILIGTGDNWAKIHLIFGNESEWTTDVNLSNADASFYGEETGDFAGHSVAGAGDVNGDGYDDILIGAHLNDEGGGQAGKTYLILGKESGWSKNTNLSTADASFYGESSDDYAGVSVAGAGDVNNDGYDDILIGASYSDDAFMDAGEIYLILGKESSWKQNINLTNADASFLGEEAHDNAGSVVAGAGDFNNDGYDDILIGAKKYDDGANSNAGKAYLILGRASPWIMDFSLANVYASFIGEAAGDFAGYSVAGAGDVNDDGYDDILIGAYSNDEGPGDNAGQAYLIFGEGTLSLSKDMDLSNADASFLGEAADDWAGYSVAGVGDINNDGFDDILIGAYGSDDLESNSGKVYLILGKKTSSFSLNDELSNADATFFGEAIGDYAGRAVAGGGDVNGDGYDDILIGVKVSDTDVTDNGKAYLIFGENGDGAGGDEAIPGYLCIPLFGTIAATAIILANQIYKKKN